MAMNEPQPHEATICGSIAQGRTEARLACALGLDRADPCRILVHAMSLLPVDITLVALPSTVFGGVLASCALEINDPTSGASGGDNMHLDRQAR